MFAGLAPLIMALTAAPAAEQPVDPLSTALFNICPALLSGALSEKSDADLEALGFHLLIAKNGRSYIASPNPFDVLIDVPLMAKGPHQTCSVNLMNTSAQARHDRLIATLKANGLLVTELPSPMGGGLINAKRPDSGELVTTSQEFNDSILTLVTGA